MEEHPLISLCMIVKDEERWLGNCLESICRAVNEIIVVDTGSSDGTKEICASFGAKVFDYIWSDSFAEARNYGIKKAEGEWILWLDADEELEISDGEQFANMLGSYENDALAVPIVSYYGKFPVDAGRAYTFCSYRLFKNYRGHEFVGDIHEYPDIKGGTLNVKEDMVDTVRIYHYGYMDEIIEDKKKSKRNIQLLQRIKSDDPNNPWINYHLASEYHRAGKSEMAFIKINEAIGEFLNKRQIAPAIVYKLKYDILIFSCSFKSAWPGIEKAIELYPDYVDLHFYKGLIFYYMEIYEAAIAVFSHCLKLGEQSYQYLTLVGCGSYKSWYYIGRCHEKMGRNAAAAEAYKQSVSIYKNYKYK